MTLFVGQIVLAQLLLMVLHVSAMAIAARQFGISIKEISYCLGPVLLRIGKVSIRTLPLGGYIKFKDTEDGGIPPDAPPGYTLDAYNHQPRLVQVALPLLGAGVLVAAAMLLHPVSGMASVQSGFSQLFAGAFAPLSTAQNYIAAVHQVARGSGFFAMSGVVAAKMAAIHLLPLGFLGGGQAIFFLLRRDSTRTPRWQELVTAWTIFPWLAVCGSWLVALVHYLVVA
jgi:membrane-associated protease RseP (regulator of RpoE activity)